MTYQTLIEIVSACHLSHFVSSPHHSRGGLMIVSPPGGLKTTAIEVLDHFATAKVLSDINVQSLIRLRDDILAGDVQTIAFTDLEKIYRRHSAVAMNVQGILMGLAEEGFRQASFQDQRMTTLPARCTIIGGMTTKCYESHITDWADTGFARRFLWVHYRMNASATKLEDAIKRWERYIIDHDFVARLPADRIIPAAVIPKKIHQQFDYYLKHQRSRLTPRIVLQRIYAVLAWKFSKTPKQVNLILNDFLPAISADGAVLEV
jgi:hypothetical protein